MNNRKRVVVTGLGVVSPTGIGCENFFSNLVSGKSGIKKITFFDPTPQACQIAGEVSDFVPDDYFDKKYIRRSGRYCQFALVAADEAIRQSGLDLSEEDTTRICIIVASAIGDFPMIEEQVRRFYEYGPGKMNPLTVPRASSNMASAHLSMKRTLMGPGFGISSACATSCHAIALGSLLLQSGISDMALVGGTEASICPTYLESYIALRALSTRNDEPTCASRPFDRDRDGFVLAEGAGILILETLEHAAKREADILAELIGFGMSSDAYHITAPHPDGRGAAIAMEKALECAMIAPDEIDYINAHGTSTPMNDPMETKAIKTVFGQNAYHIPVSSIKSMIGHGISAAGAIEAIASIMALRADVIPPTINLDNPDPECDLDYVPNKSREKKLACVMSNSFAFGGQNCVLVFKKWRVS